MKKKVNVPDGGPVSPGSKEVARLSLRAPATRISGVLPESGTKVEILLYADGRAHWLLTREGRMASDDRVSKRDGFQAQAFLAGVLAYRAALATRTMKED